MVDQIPSNKSCWIFIANDFIQLASLPILIKQFPQSAQHLWNRSHLTTKAWHLCSFDKYYMVRHLWLILLAIQSKSNISISSKLPLQNIKTPLKTWMIFVSAKYSKHNYFQLIQSRSYLQNKWLIDETSELHCYNWLRHHSSQRISFTNYIRNSLSMLDV